MLYNKYLFFQCILLLGIQNFGSCDEDTDLDKAGVELLKHMIHSTYKADKLKLITNFMENIFKESDPDNFTLVGTQQILNPDGSVKEVRAVALHLPAKKSSKSLHDEEEIGDDEGSFDELRDTFRKYSHIGLPIEVAYEQKDKDGNLEESTFIGDHITFRYTDGVGYVNKTKYTDQNTADENIKALKGISKVPVTELTYDSSGKLVKDKSVVSDENPIVSIDGIDSKIEFPFALLKKIIKFIIKILGYIFATKNETVIPNVDELVQKVAAALNEEFPEFVFLIIPGNPDSAHVDYDLYVKANYGLVDSEDGLPVNIYAVKKSA